MSSRERRAEEIVYIENTEREREVQFRNGKRVTGDDATPKGRKVATRNQSRRSSVTSQSSVMMRQVLGDAEFEFQKERRKDKLVNDFFKDEIDRMQQKEIIMQRKEAKKERDEAIKKREKVVNPLMEKLLKEHYGVVLSEKKRQNEKKWSVKQCKDKVNDLYRWKNKQIEKKEIRERDRKEEEIEECPFTPNLTNYSRHLMQTKGKKIKKRIKDRQKALTDKKAKKNNRRAGNTGGKNKSIMDPEQADTFYKRMSDWNDRKDKLIKQKIVDKWVNEHKDDTEELQLDKKRRKRDPRKQVEHAEELLRKRQETDRKLEKKKKDQLKGLFYPKTTKHIPVVIQKEFEKRRREKMIEEYILEEGRVPDYINKVTTPSKQLYGSSSKKSRNSKRSKRMRGSPGRNMNMDDDMLINLVSFDEANDISFTESMKAGGEIISSYRGSPIR